MAVPESFEIRIGVDGKNWFVGVRPPIPREMLERMGGDAMSGWAIEQFEPTTVFRKYTNASEEATRSDIGNFFSKSGLAFSLMQAGATEVNVDYGPYDMSKVVSPFDTDAKVTKTVDPVVEATDKRIRERGLAEFGDMIARMGADPSYAPDPLNLVASDEEIERDEISFAVPDDISELDGFEGLE